MDAFAEFQLFHKLLGARLVGSFDTLCENLANHHGLGPFDELADVHKDAILDCAAKICAQSENVELRERYGSKVDPIFDVVAELQKTARQIAQVESVLQSTSEQLEIHATLTDEAP